jgi:hypothetical protein
MLSGNVLIFIVPLVIAWVPFGLRYLPLTKKPWWRSLVFGLPLLWGYAFLLYGLDSSGKIHLSYGLYIFFMLLVLYSLLVLVIAIAQSEIRKERTTGRE